MTLFLKTSGFILMAICGFLLGERKAFMLTKRTAALFAMHSYLLFLARNIRYKKDALQALLRESAALCEFAPLCFVLPMSAAHDWPQHLAAALETARLALKDIVQADEFAIFSSALTELGSADAESEEKKLLYQSERIKAIYDIAKDEEVKQKKLYRVLGLSAGVSIAIIMM